MNYLIKILYKIKHEGVLTTYKIIKDNLIEKYWEFENYTFDTVNGVDTGGQIDNENLDIQSTSTKYGVRYEPTTLNTFKSIISNIQELEKFTFVDFGSGKGRVLLLASRYNFKEIIGVEYSESLYKLSLNNINNYKKKVCQNIQIINCDATEYKIPSGNCILYFYQPFVGEVMLCVLMSIKNSFIANKRKIYLIFLHPHATLQTNFIETFASKIITKPLRRDFAWRHKKDMIIFETCF